MRFYTIGLIIFLFFGCKANEFTLENKPKINLKEAFYSIVPPAIEESVASTQIVVEINTRNTESFVLNGLYFRNNYIKKKDDSYPNKMITFFKNNENNSKGLKEKIPFDLMQNEIVVDYSLKNVRKFAKFKIKRKENLDNIPM